jgi:hypothetical protein
MTTKPLWRQFVDMSEEEALVEQATEFACLETGEMTEAKRKERVAAWRRAAKWHADESDRLKKMVRLARATGCPKNVPVVRWLIRQDLLVKAENEFGFAFTDKANELHVVADNDD